MNELFYDCFNTISEDMIKYSVEVKDYTIW